MKKLISVLCCLTLLLSGPVPAEVIADYEGAVPAEAEFELGTGSAYGDAPVLDDEATNSADELLLTSADPEELVTDGSGLDAAYDVRDHINIPEARKQGSWNSCWLVAAMGAMEITALKKGLTVRSASSINYSEWHLAYFLSHSSVDPLGNISKDYNTNLTHWISDGANPLVAAMTLASWHGVAEEQTTGMYYSAMGQESGVNAALAYEDTLHLENTYSVDLSDAEGCNTLKRLLMEYGAAVLCLYYNEYNYLYSGAVFTGTDGASGEATEEPSALDAVSETETSAETEASEEIVTPEGTEILEETEISGDTDIPAETETSEGAETSAEVETSGEAEEFPEELIPVEDAEELISDGAAEGFEEETEPPSDGEAETTVCYYQDAKTGTNHEVIVIGWDDNYPKENFSLSHSGATPAGDGAWLCRNSYGPEWKCDGGYFWVSYYDKSVSADTSGSVNSRAVVFDVASASNYDNNYQYDGAVVQGNVLHYSLKEVEDPTRTVWYANVFTAAGRESLQAVSTYTYYPGVSYTVSIYTDIQDTSDPTSGTLAATETGTFTLAGFHTVKLGDTVRLSKGKSFSVVFRVGVAANRTLYVPACFTSEKWYSVNAAEAGQSFVSSNGTEWADCCDGIKNSSGITDQPNVNVRIKAYTGTPFEDTEDSWYTESVSAVWGSDLMDGTSGTRFSPDANATRAEVIDALWRLAGRPSAKKTITFDDVSSGDECYTALCWAASKGIALGSDDDGDGIYSFRPEDAVTREECVTFLWRYEGSPKTTGSVSDFGDANTVSTWALTAECWSIKEGIQTGLAGHGVFLLRPDYILTRAQLAEFIARLM